MQKPIFKDLKNNINTLIDFSESLLYSKEELQEMIMQLLNDTYKAISTLNEVRFKHDLPKIEHDRIGSIKPYIDHYKTLYDKALEDEDTDLAWRYGFASGIFQSFQKNPTTALKYLKLLFTAAIIDRHAPEYKERMLSILEKHSPKDYEKQVRIMAISDLYIDLYKQLEGYQITHNLILKSSALRLFRFFDVVTKVKKRTLATHIEYLFSSLGEDKVSVDPKRAGSVKQSGEFNGFPLYDYLGNKKNLSYDFGLDEMFLELLPKVAESLRQEGLDKQANALLIGKEALKLSLVFDILKL